MRSPIMVVCLLLLMIASVGQIFGVTLDPGTYKMQWVFTKGDFVPGYPEEIPLGTMSTDYAKELHGLVSNRGLCGAYGPLILILDESKGTGKGYDVIYVVPETRWNAGIELKKAPRMKLMPSANGVLKADIKSLSQNPLVGGSETVRVRDILKSFSCEHYPDDQGRRKMAGEVEIRGRWQGKIKSDRGDLSVNVNTGIRNDFDSPADDRPGSPSSQPGPALSIEALRIGVSQMVYPAKASQFGKKLYDIRVTSAGDTVTVQPYTGPLGTVRIKGIDGLGKPSVVSEIGMIGTPGIFFTSHDSELQVPLGNDYSTQAGVVCAVDGPGKKPFGVVITKNAVEVAADRIVELTMGGPIKMELTAGPSTTVMEHKSGEIMRLEVALSIDKDTTVEVPVKVTIVVKDAADKVLINDTTRFQDDSYDQYYILKIPASWQPGSYTIEATLDIRPYQDLLTVTRELRVVK